MFHFWFLPFTGTFLQKLSGAIPSEIILIPFEIYNLLILKRGDRAVIYDNTHLMKHGWIDVLLHALIQHYTILHVAVFMFLREHSGYSCILYIFMWHMAIIKLNISTGRV